MRCGPVRRSSIQISGSLKPRIEEQRKDLDEIIDFCEGSNKKRKYRMRDMRGAELIVLKRLSLHMPPITMKPRGTHQCAASTGIKHVATANITIWFASLLGGWPSRE